ncbi:MAG: adenosylcobinamide-GDP ribazoletransferase [Nitrospirae bacterium]|nr:adenosylcobinamide-GDP ribazoletransferase [Nitrospirota bacterium]
MIAPLFIALGFLTILPIPVKGELRPADMGKAMAFFPVAGAVIGGVLISADIVLSSILPGAVVDFILIAVLALITGGIHLDGLADTFDGLYGGKTREDALSIMKDSRVGAIGAVSLIIIIGLKYTALISYSQALPQGSKYAALFLMPLLSRWSMVLTAFLSVYARMSGGGTGKDFVETVSPLSLLTATLFASVAAGVMMGWRGGLVMLFVGGITLIGVIYFKKRLGGVTGDVLGAVNEVNEVMVLLVILIISQFK